MSNEFSEEFDSIMELQNFHLKTSSSRRRTQTDGTSRIQKMP